MRSKALVIYYSLTGNTKLIAEAIQVAIGAEILELKLEKELTPNKPKSFLWAGFSVIMRKKPKLKLIEIDPLDYDLIFLGTPVWASNFSSPIRTFLHMYDLKGKHIAIWNCQARDKQKAIKRLEKELVKNEAKIVGKILFKEPKENNPDEATQKAVEWAKEMFLLVDVSDT